MNNVYFGIAVVTLIILGIAPVLLPPPSERFD
jgi:hypothetical protein